MSKINSPESITELPLAIVKNMITLATSGFGVVVALAWNEAIKSTVNQFINPYLGKGGGVISLLIYALIMTILAVVVTMQLSGLEKKMTLLNESLKAKRARARLKRAEIKSKQNLSDAKNKSKVKNNLKK